MKSIFALRIISGFVITSLAVIVSSEIVQAQTNIKSTESNSDRTTINPAISQSNSASDLTSQSSNSNTLKITQSDFEIEPGTETRSGSSYIGIGGNIGLSGETTVSQGAFAVISKIGMTNYLSIRPSALIEDNTVFLLPVTVDFSGDEVANAEFSIAPYLGGGLAISTARDDTVGGLISGGLDIPLSSEFTANAGVNVTFIDNTDVGLLLGVGYNL
jgi:hypothetical protein